MNSILLLIPIFQIFTNVEPKCLGGRVVGEQWSNATVLCKTQFKTYLNPSPQTIPSRVTCGLDCSAKGPNFALLFYCVDKAQLLTIFLEDYRTVIICCALHGGALSHRKLKGFVWFESKPGITLWW